MLLIFVLAFASYHLKDDVELDRNCSKDEVVKVIEDIGQLHF